jgi:hypothetical protein
MQKLTDSANRLHADRAAMEIPTTSFRAELAQLGFRNATKRDLQQVILKALAADVE